MFMKKIYSILSLLMLISIALSAQTKIYAPTLKSPDNGKLNQMPDVVIDWLAVTGITLDITYEAQLATQTDFSDAVTFPRTELTSVQTTDLTFGETYFWRVRAFDGELASDWSSVWSFTVVWTPTLRSVPSDGAMVYSNPEITWNPLTGITHYQFQIDTSYAWHEISSGVSISLNGTYMVNEADIWVVGNGGKIIHFDGDAWTVVESGVTSDLNDVWFVDASHGYAVGAGGTIIFYDGSTWSEQASGISTDLFGVSFADADKGVAVGAGGKILMYSTGVWTSASSPVTTDIQDVAVVAENNIWACGKSKMVLHYDGNAWSSEEVGTKDYFGISFQDENNGWVVGKTGSIYRYDGAAWIQEYTNITKDLLGVSVSNFKGYAVGKSGTLLALEGGWSLVSSGTTKDLQSVFAYGDNFGLIVGASGTALEKTNVGFNSPDLKTITQPKTITAYTLANLAYGQTYYYRIRAIHGNDTSAWSQVKSMTTYPTVDLAAPADGAEVDLEILASWTDYEGTAEYTLEVDDNEGFLTPYMASSDSNSAYVELNHFGHQYYWRVLAENAFHISGWSEVFTFTTKNSIALTTPENGTTEVSSCPKFVWEGILGVQHYEVWLAKTADFADPVSSTTDAPFLQCAAPMDRNTTYFWKVRGLTLVDTSAWSPVWSFTTEGYIGINENLNAEALTVYPNPNSGQFVLQLESYTSDNYRVKVADITGRIVYDEQVSCVPGENKMNIVLPEVNQGIYNLIISKGEESISQKILVQ
jgi:hypothetical protein